MSSQTTTRQAESSEDREVAQAMVEYWWLWLVTGIAWIVAALVILQFDGASITTIGILVGAMFAFAGVQQLMVAAVYDSLRWLWALFGVLFLIAGVICFINPEHPLPELRDILRHLFHCVAL